MSDPSGNCRLVSRGVSDRGYVRRRNEDAVLDMPEAGLWAVADGMGGHADGDLASQAVVRALAGLGASCAGRVLVERIPAALQQVNAELVWHGAGKVVGSTVAVLVLEGENYHCFWAGDSRVYLWRDGGLRQLTRDHAVAGGHARGALTRAVGAEQTLELDYLTDYLYEGDLFLLCSDGLTTVVDDETIADALHRCAPEQVSQRLLEAALRAGAPDNVSCVSVFVG